MLAVVDLQRVMFVRQFLEIVFVRPIVARLLQEELVEGVDRIFASSIFVHFGSADHRSCSTRRKTRETKINVETIEEERKTYQARKMNHFLLSSDSRSCIL